MNFKSIFLTVSLAFAGCNLVLAQENVMTPDKLWELGRVSLDGLSDDGKTALYGVTNYNIEENKGNRDLYLVEVKSGKVTQLTNTPGGEYGAQFLGDKIGYSAGGQFWLMEKDGSNPKQITNIGEAGNWKAFEKGTEIVLLFSKSTKVFQTTQDLYPNLPQAEVKIIDDLMYRHWDHWTTENVDHLCYATYKGEMVEEFKDIMPNEPWSTPIPPFDGSEDFTLTPDGNKIIYVGKKMKGKDFALSTNTDLYQYDIITGNTSNITFKNKGYDKEPQLNETGELLAWTSMERDGYESDLNRLMIAKPGSDKWLNVSQDEHVLGFTWGAKNTIYALIAKEATQQIVQFSFDLDKGTSSMKQITSGDYNYGHFEVSGKTIVAQRQDMNHANELYTVSSRGKAKQLTHVNDDIYENISLSKIEKRWVTTTDGRQMLTWVVFPPNFDESKKYPTLLYCQGGPQSAVSQFYSFRWNFQLMAAQGYIVVAPNRRGLPGFGQAWNEAISKDWGGQAMRDYLSAIDDVKGMPYVDDENIGAVGASYGGYSVYMLAGIHDGRFSALISHCGLFNLESWYATTEEMFFANFDIGGPYWTGEASESYAQFNPKNYVGKWTAPIMVIHGGLDFRVPENQGMEAFNAAQLQGIPSKMVYFPNEGHWVLNPQNGLIWHDQFFGWLDQWLKN